MITILTLNRSKSFLRFFYYLLKYVFLFFSRKYFLDIKSFIIDLKYSGHSQVARSLCSGLKENNIKFNINPKKNKDFNKIVIVLSGIEQINKCIKLKKQNIIKYIFAGPNLFVLPSDNQEIFIDKFIDYLITPSKWVTNSYLNDIKDYDRKIFEWYAGIDENYWIRKNHTKKKDVLIYLKENNTNKFDIKRYLNFLDEIGFGYHIIRYGSYNNKLFLKLLNNSLFCIFFSRSESQGIALAEAWATDTPTLVFNNNFFFYKNKKIRSETAPYLSKKTGALFSDFNEFKLLVNKFISKKINYNPREWILSHMTDKISTKKLLHEINKRVDN